MKRLLLVRHAKSSWDDATLRDVDRPLNARGERDAPEMGKRLRKAGCQPELIVCSHARRALRTAQIMAEQFGYPVADIDIRDELYEASIATWFSVLRSLPDDRELVMLVGHNPELTELANRLSGSSIDNMPTCAVLRLDYELGSWRDFDGARALAWDLDYPKRH